MYRAAKEGKKIGRPRVTDRRGFGARYNTVLERLRGGDISRRKAARELGIGYATLKRLLGGDGTGINVGVNAGGASIDAGDIDNDCGGFDDE